MFTVLETADERRRDQLERMGLKPVMRNTTLTVHVRHSLAYPAFFLHAEETVRRRYLYPLQL